ncbi:TIGR01777 family oxidoreductase [Sphaerisporangium rubeum]|uniref:TIGR01777 family protein n=1 Tax=Sphaerisporangium rubeum TaxID=321317 RepID=A0A7X0IIL6_9ACTN|nr:DUF1731 domain-containing protein [Sphaerisporangium rubeum]MBB6474688.1 hypothetical protein [Sphaerisporangium rubeum]
MSVVVTGSSGLIGTALVRALRDRGHSVVRLVRRPPAGADEAFWDPREGVLDPGLLEGAEAVVHLAGAGIADRRWTDAYRRELLASRVDSTRLIATTVAGLGRPPRVLLSASAMGIYGDTGDRAVDESAKLPVGPSTEPGTSPAATAGAAPAPPAEPSPQAPGLWLAGLAAAWEAETVPAAEAGVRVVLLRTGHVLTRDGGFLGKQLPLFRLGLGAPLGSGRQYTSWITMEDWLGAVEFLLAGSAAGAAGPVNLTAPNPVTNAEFTKALGRALGRPTLPVAVPPFVLRAALGALADEGVLIGQRVLPARLLEMGYRFRHPHVDEALAAIL